MKIGILIPVYNRPQYLKETLWSLERCEIGCTSKILIVDDASTEAETKRLIENFDHPNAFTQKVYFQNNRGVKKNLLYGYENLFANGFTHVINFDSDTLIKPNAVTELLKHYIPGTLLTGFHCTTMGRHKIIDENPYIQVMDENGMDCGWLRPDLYLKQSVGGINFCVDKAAYEKYIKPALQIQIGNWDADACRDGAYCLKQSVVQHIGIESSLGHHDNPDVAGGFKFWDLPDVTLICVDSDLERVKHAASKCLEQINFGSSQFLSPDIRSKEEYSKFCMRELYKHVTTSHMLVFQHDGYVNNWKAWDNDWLQYDYIGSPWWYTDGMNVGNGGFSLRSRRLMEIVATDPTITEMHPEDHQICRTYRAYLESKYGIKFAPQEVAEKFSFEGFRQPDKFLSDQFGRHGSAARVAPVRVSNKKYVIGQFASLGDILFLIPLIRALTDEGNTCLWPVNPEYLSLEKHFPDINFVDRSVIPIDYESRRSIDTPYGKWLPYRFASENMGRRLDKCMVSKYEMFGHNWSMWRELTWKRDYTNEAKLIELLDLPEKFVLVNRYYGNMAQLQITPKLPDHTPIIEMRNIEGFTLIDWMGVVELASEVHSANTSILYLFEHMDLRIPIHLYRRNIWGEQAFEYTSMLHTKSYILH